MWGKEARERGRKGGSGKRRGKEGTEGGREEGREDNVMLGFHCGRTGPQPVASICSWQASLQGCPREPGAGSLTEVPRL